MASPRIFAYFGTDEGRVREAAQKKVAELVPEGEREFGLEVVDGVAENADGAGEICRQAIEAIQTLPFLGGDKTVWLRGGNFFDESQTGKAIASLEGQEALLTALEAVTPDVAVVISGGKISKNRKFYKGLSKLSKPTFLDKPDLGSSDWPVQAAAIAGQSAQRRGLEFAPTALELFVMMVGEDSSLLDNEMEKLDLYLGPERRQATEDDVRAIAAKTSGGIIFEIGEAIARKDLGHAIARMEVLLERGENAVGIMRAAVIPQVRNLLFSRDLAERHGVHPQGAYNGYAAAIARLPASETAHLPQKKAGGVNAYGLFMAAKSGGGGYSVAQLTAALGLCLQADLELVSTQTPPLTVMTKLLVGIMS